MELADPRLQHTLSYDTRPRRPDSHDMGTQSAAVLWNWAVSMPVQPLSSTHDICRPGGRPPVFGRCGRSCRRGERARRHQASCTARSSWRACAPWRTAPVLGRCSAAGGSACSPPPSSDAACSFGAQRVLHNNSLRDGLVVAAARGAEFRQQGLEVDHAVGAPGAR